MNAKQDSRENVRCRMGSKAQSEHCLWGKARDREQVTLEKHGLSAEGAQDFLVRFGLSSILVSFVRLFGDNGFADVFLEAG